LVVAATRPEAVFNAKTMQIFGRFGTVSRPKNGPGRA
jgi:hypothetical protein